MSELQTRASRLGNGWRPEKRSIRRVLQTIKGIIQDIFCFKALEVEANVFSLVGPYFCSLQDSVSLEKEHLQVYLRVRPFTAAEKAEGEEQVYIINTQNIA